MKWLIKQYMAQAHIESLTELAERAGMTRRLLYDRLADPKTFRVYEIMALDKVLNFSDEDLIFLLRGEKHNELRQDNVRRLFVS